MKKWIAAALALVLLLLVSCENSKQAAGQEDGLGGEDQSDISGNDSMPDDTADEMDYTSHLPEADFEGYQFRFLARKTEGPLVCPDGQTSEVINDAIFKRNQEVASRYNVSFSVTESSNSNYDTDALNTILAGDDAYDLILPHVRASFKYALSGALMNWHDIASIDLSKPWWVKDLQNSCTVNGKLYVMDGDLSIQSLRCINCLLFNKKLFDEIGIDYPYDMVKNGEWTFDEFAKIVRQGGQDLNGDGLRMPEDDRYGVVAGEWDMSMAVLYTGGQRIFDIGEDGLPYLSLYSEKTVDIFDTYFDLMDSDDAFLMVKDHYEPLDMFRNDRTLMRDVTWKVIQGYRDMESDFGVIPYPKFSKDDDYATIVNAGSALLCIPTTVTDPERTGTIIEALCAIGSREIVPAFYNISLQTKFARDDASAEMMDIIRDSRVYDLGYLTSQGVFQNVGCDLARLENHDFASFYAERESAALKEVEAFIEAYGGTDSK